MTRHCFADPLDPAVDVCDECAGDFCAHHLVDSKAHKNQICIECALVLAGVRGGGSIAKIGDPKTAKARRQELRNAVAMQATAFQFFDEGSQGPTTADTAGPMSEDRGRTETFDEHSAEQAWEIETVAADSELMPWADEQYQEPQKEAVEPIESITDNSATLEQIVADKKNRAEQLASELAQRLD